MLNFLSIRFFWGRPSWQTPVSFMYLSFESFMPGKGIEVECLLGGHSPGSKWTYSEGHVESWVPRNGFQGFHAALQLHTQLCLGVFWTPFSGRRSLTIFQLLKEIVWPQKQTWCKTKQNKINPNIEWEGKGEQWRHTHVKGRQYPLQRKKKKMEWGYSLPEESEPVGWEAGEGCWLCGQGDVSKRETKNSGVGGWVGVVRLSWGGGDLADLVSRVWKLQCCGLGATGELRNWGQGV